MTKTRRHVPRRRPLEATRLYPVIGLVTILALGIAVYISYNASTGTPFQRFDRFTVDLPSANRLVKAAEVRVAGVRVGQIKKVEAVPAPAGEPGATSFSRAFVQVPKGSLRVPVDTVASVRPASVLGSTYLDLQLGRSSESVPDGGNLPVAQARSTVELTDLLDLFDRRTARDLQRAIVSTGDGLAGRGADLGQAFTATAGFLPALQAVAANLAAPGTRLAPFVTGSRQFVAALAAERQALGSGLDGADRTFAGLDRSRPAIASTIDRFPAAASTTTSALRRLRPSLDRLADISAELLPAAERLPRSVRTLSSTVQAATPSLRLFGEAGGAAAPAGRALASFASAPSVDGLIRKAESAVVSAAPLVTAVKDAQVYCNSVSTFSSWLASTFADDGVGKGPAVVSIRIKGLGGNPLELLQNGKTLPGVHTNYQPNQNKDECEAGNEPYDPNGISVTNPKGNQSTAHVETHVDPELDRQARSTRLLDAPPEAVKP